MALLHELRAAYPHHVTSQECTEIIHDKHDVHQINVDKKTDTHVVNWCNLLLYGEDDCSAFEHVGQSSRTSISTKANNSKLKNKQRRLSESDSEHSNSNSSDHSSEDSSSPQSNNIFDEVFSPLQSINDEDYWFHSCTIGGLFHDIGSENDCHSKIHHLNYKSSTTSVVAIQSQSNPNAKLQLSQNPQKANEHSDKIDIRQRKPISNLPPSQLVNDNERFIITNEELYGSYSLDYYFHDLFVAHPKTSDSNFLNEKIPQMMRDFFNHKTCDETLLQNVDLRRCGTQNSEAKLQRLQNSQNLWFSRWKATLYNNLNILVTGFGSKISLLNNFAKQFLSDGFCIIIKGYSATVSLKAIAHRMLNVIFNVEIDNYKNSKLDEIMQELQHQMSESEKHFEGIFWGSDYFGCASENGSSKSGDCEKCNETECTSTFWDNKSVESDDVTIEVFDEENLNYSSQNRQCPGVASSHKATTNETDDNSFDLPLCPIYLVIHSIDSRYLQNYQAVISSIAKFNRVHIIASADHLQYNSILTSNFEKKLNFVSIKVDTFLDYSVEVQELWTDNQSPWLNEAETDEAIANEQEVMHRYSIILQSLTENHRKVVKILTKLLTCDPASDKETGDKLNLKSKVLSRNGYVYARYDEVLKTISEKLLCDRTQLDNLLSELISHKMILKDNKRGCTMLGMVDNKHILRFLTKEN